VQVFQDFCQRQGCQRTLEALEDPEKPWILFAPGKIPWKTLKLHPTPEKLCSEAFFSVHQLLALQYGCIFYSCSAGEEDL